VSRVSTSVQSPIELFAVDGLIGDEEAAIRDAVRKWVAANVQPSISEWFESGTIPARELARDLGTLGVLGMHLDGYGCAGTSATAYGLACMELEAGDSGLRSLVSVQGSLAMFAIWKHGSEEQRQQWLPRMAAGETIGCFVLSGTKMWITNGSIADVAVVWARAADDGKVRGFIVPTDARGFSAPEVKHKLSLRASVTSELVLDDVRVPAAAVLPGASGLSGPLSCLNEARYGIVFGALGAARDCIDTTLAYARERQIFERSLASYQLTQAKLADMSLELGKGLLLALHLGRLKDNGELRPEQISLGKLNNVREALQIARECRTILGAAGITLEYPVMRHASNLESVLTYEGTSEVHQLVVGQRLTGCSAFR
jgi:glutaryl-CoA dehydrogenase